MRLVRAQFEMTLNQNHPGIRASRDLPCNNIQQTGSMEIQVWCQENPVPNVGEDILVAKSWHAIACEECQT